jgi:hypothetical protein
LRKDARYHSPQVINSISATSVDGSTRSGRWYVRHILVHRFSLAPADSKTPHSIPIQYFELQIQHHFLASLIS